LLPQHSAPYRASPAPHLRRVARCPLTHPVPRAHPVWWPAGSSGVPSARRGAASAVTLGPSSGWAPSSAASSSRYRITVTRSHGGHATGTCACCWHHITCAVHRGCRSRLRHSWAGELWAAFRMLHHSGATHCASGLDQQCPFCASGAGRGGSCCSRSGPRTSARAGV
jgi:hypothetical protein